LDKQTTSEQELRTLIDAALERAVGSQRKMAISIEGHIRDGLGRNWDIVAAAPTPAHRKAIDSVRDLYDLG
jgi:hypothetical protein